MARATTKKAPAKKAEAPAAKKPAPPTISNDHKGEVMHDPKIKLVTFYASGSKGEFQVKYKGKWLERGYWAKTIDGQCPYGPSRLRQMAVDEAYEWRKRIVLGPRRGPLVKKGKGE